MRKFVSRVATFSFFILILIAVFLVITRNVITKNLDKYLKIFYQEEIYNSNWVLNEKQYDIIFLGSSTLRYGLSMEILEDANTKSINLAMDARDPIVSFLLLDNYLKDLNVKQVYIGLDPWIYTKNYYKHRGAIMHLDLDLIKSIYLLKEKKYSINKTYVKIFSNTILKREKPFKKLETPKGFGSYELFRSAVNFDLNEDFFQIEEYGWSELQFNYLHKIDSLCKKNNIDPVYIIPPKRNDYNDYITKNLIREHKEWWTRVKSKIGNAKLLSYYDLFAAENQDSIFAESYHLNYKGQKLFTHWFLNNKNKTRRLTDTITILKP